jgi:tetratricopeptide (TPR) repeat protein
MKNNLNFDEFIERYLDGEMGTQEKIWFEKELDANPKLQKELELRRNINNAIQEKDVMELRGQLEEIYSNPEHQETVVKRSTTIFNRKLLVLVSTVLILIVGSLLILLLKSNSYTNKEIYAMYYRPYEATLNFRSADNGIDNDLRTAMQYYENRDFRNALVLFERILSEDGSRIGLNLYSGISHMEVNEFDDAHRKFQKIIDHNHNLFIEQAEWYLGFCYLMTDNTEKAKMQFNQIAEKDGYYAPKAMEILKRMK